MSQWLPVSRWGLVFRSNNRLDGERVHLVFENCLPRLFVTRKQARDYAEQRYGYIRTRKDLQAEPHGWQMPKPIKLIVAACPPPPQQEEGQNR